MADATGTDVPGRGSLVLVAALLGTFFVRSTVSEGDGRTRWWVEIVVGLAAFTLLALFRRRRPVTLTLILIPLGILFGLPRGATPIALFAVALHRRARTATILAAVHAVKAYVSRILTKLELTNRVQVALLVHDARWR